MTESAVPPLIRIRALARSYRIGRERLLPVLRGIDLDIHSGEFVALMGPSGSGKSTLMNVLGLLDGFDGGSYQLDGREVAQLSDREAAALRAHQLGFVFQQFNLIPQLTVWENVALPLFYLGGSRTERRARAQQALSRVGLAHRLDHRPLQLSGGEMQRCAIARSLVTEAPLVVADEPTGNLDSRTGAEILGLFQDLHRQGLTLVMVTHDAGVAARADRVVRLRDGRIIEDAKPDGKEAIGGTIDAPSPGSPGAGRQRAATRLLRRPHAFRAGSLISMALASLRHHQLRALLTTLGIVFGVGAVLAMLAISEGARRESLAGLAGMGLDTIRLNTVEPPAGQLDDNRWIRLFGLKDTDQQRLAALLPDLQTVVRTRREDEDLWTLTHATNTHLIVTAAAYQGLGDLDLARGRFLHPLDDARRQAVCVLGADMARDLFPLNDPLGKMVYLRRDGIPLCVIGVLRPRTTGLPGSGIDAATLNRACITSERAMRYRLGFVMFSETNHIHDLILRFGPDSDVRALAEVVRASLARAHDKDDWQITVPAELLAQEERTSQIFAIVMGSIAGISLLVGGIGIMNIMLATVLERTREIGIRRAIGAHRRDIVFQFLVETIVLTTLGGCLGIALGMGGAQLVAEVAGWPTHVSAGSIVLALGISALVGLVFGLYPAWRAANLKPVEALRSA